MKKKLAISLLFFCQLALAAPVERVQSISLNKGDVTRVIMSPGLATVMTFPCDIDEAVNGREEILTVTVSETNKRQLTLSLANGTGQPTNLIVRCGDKQDVFAFDIIASRSTHQYVVKITSAHGRPGYAGDDMKLVDSSEGKKTVEVRQKKVHTRMPPTLIEESK